MKILHVIPSLNDQLDGPANAIGKMCVNLKAKGLDITIYTTNLHMINYNQLSGLDLSVFKTCKNNNYCFSLGLWHAINKNIEHYDLIHIHALWVFTTTITAYIARKKNIPYIVSPHGMLDYYSVYHDKWKSLKKVLYFSVLDKFNLDNASVIHVTTSDELKRMRHMNIKAPHMIQSIGIQKTEFLSLPSKGYFRNKYSFLNGIKVILFLGRIHYKKGLEILLDAYKIVLSKTDKAYLVIAGPDNEGYKNILEKKISALNLDGKVLFTGLVGGKDKIEILADADVFCLPSFQENFGIAVAEAMAAGLPVVISDQVNIHAEISQANAGIVTRCDADEVAGAILKILNDDSLRAEMGQNARKLVFDKFTWDKIADDMVESYKKIIEEHKRKFN